MNDILNPYIAGAPVVESRMFFGREDVFNWIERSLAGRYVDHILVLHGQRRVGKTSVLKQIPNYLPERYIQVFFDLQGRTNTTLDRFLWWLAREISRTVSQALEMDIPRPDREAFAKDPEYLIRQFLPDLQSILGDRVLLLTFDEFDTLDHADIQKDFAKPLIGVLNRLIQLDYINFIFSIGSSGDKLENMQASYTEFFKSALYRKISFLTRYDCQRLITRPVEDVIHYEKKAVDRIFSITSGHPYFTQLMCHELFSMCQKTSKREIKLNDVESILSDVIERGTVNLKFVWDEANDLEKWVLAGLAHVEGKSSTEQLAQLLNTQHVRFSDSDLNSAIIHLQDKDVLTSENQFVVHLMYLWLQSNRPLERVREELEKVNPIVNRYIEIGDEYRDLGQFDQAIESYQQALSIDTENLKAHSSIAKLYMGSGDYLKAAAEYELALQIDDEDIAVQSGYCQANLVLGNEARKTTEIDEATHYYQNILMVNPAHNDARYQLAEIYQVQAEEFLTKGQDEEALSKFNAAVELMPNDDKLVARYQDVLEQKKTKVIASWLMEYERAQKNLRWDEAINAVNEALKLSPDDPHLHDMLASAEKSHHQFELASLKQKAAVATKEEKWDQAIQAWESYMTLNPADSQEAQDALANVQKYRLIAQDYNRAQELMQKRRYQDAIELLQGIIAQDPTYKSASRLLAEAVRARIPAPILKRPLFYISMALVVIVFAGIFFWPRISALLNLSLGRIDSINFIDTFLSDVSDQQMAEDSVNSFSTNVTRTPNLIPTVDPITLIQPVLDKSDNMLPIFVEDFSTPQEYWDSLMYDDQNGSIRISDLVSDGVLRILDEPIGETDYSVITLPLASRADDFRLYFDFAPQKFNYPAKLRINFRDYHFEILPSGKWFLESNYGIVRIEGYTTPFEMNQLYQFQVIAEGYHLAVVLNDKILVYHEDHIINVDEIGIHIMSYFPFQVEIDNIKYWNLDDYELALDFTEPILTHIAESPPDFLEDFSTQKAYWDGLNVELGSSHKITEEALRISDEPAVDTNYGMMFLPDEQFSDFVLQFDFNPLDFSSDSSVWILFRSDLSSDLEFSMRGDGSWNLDTFGDNEERVTLSQGKSSPLVNDQIYQFGWIAMENQIAISQNDKILLYIEDEGRLEGTIDVDIHSYEPFRVEFENIQIWDLDDNNFNEKSTKEGSILAYIADVAPDFEDDFSSVKAEWGSFESGQKMVSVAEAVSGGVLNLYGNDDGESRFPLTNLFQAKDFVIEFEYQESSSKQYTEILTALGMHLRSSDAADSYYRVGFHTYSGSWRIVKKDDNQGIFDEIDIGGIAIAETHRVRVIAHGNQYFVYLHDKLISTFQDEDINGEGNYFYFRGTESFHATVDNVKFWNLDGVDLDLLLQDELLVGESEPASFLDEISEIPPTFEDQFSYGQNTLGWSLSSGVRLNSSRPGTLDMELESGVEARAGGTHLNASDFVIQYDFYLEGSDSTSTIIDTRDGNLTFELKHNGEWLVSKDDVISQGKGQNILADQWNTLTFYTKGEHFVIYLNNTILTTFTEIVSGRENALRAKCEMGESGKVIIDNYKFWNLDKVDLDLQVTSSPEFETTDLIYKIHVFDSAISSLAWSDHHEMNNLLAVAGLEDHVVILNGSTGRETRDPIWRQSQIVSVGWNPDGGGDRLAIGDVDGLVSVYRKVQGPGPLEGPFRHDSLVEIGEITELSFGDIEEDWHTGNYLAASTSTGYIAIWINEGTLIWEMQIEQGPVVSLDWNLWNHQILTVSENEGVQVWSASNGSRLQWLQYVSTSAAWSPDGRYIVLEDHTTGPSAVVVIKSSTEQARLDLPAGVNKIAWSPDGNFIGAGGNDGSVWVINGLDDGGQLESLEILYTYEQDSEVTDMVWSPDSDVILTGDINGNIWAWRVR